MGSGDQAGRVEQTQRFTLVPSAQILSADKQRFLAPDEDEIGWIARTGHVPLGYLDDEPRPPRRSRSSTACASRCPATVRSSRPTVRSCSWAATRWW